MTRRELIVLAFTPLLALVALVGSASSRVAPSLLTAGLTTLFGFIVFVIGQVVLKVLIEPAQEQRNIIGRTTHALRYYDYQPFQVASHPATFAFEGEKRSFSESMPPDFVKHAKAEFNQLSAELTANMHLIPSYKRLARWGFVRPDYEIADAAMGLVELSITFGDPSQEQGFTRESLNRVTSALGISLGPSSV